MGIGKFFSTIGGAFAPELNQVQSGIDNLTLAFEVIIGELMVIIVLMALSFFIPKKG